MTKKLNFFEKIYCGWIHCFDIFSLWSEIVSNKNPEENRFYIFFNYLQHDYIDYVEATWWRGACYNKLGVGR
jgi:hypothetical protein